MADSQRSTVRLIISLVNGREILAETKMELDPAPASGEYQLCLDVS